MNCQPPFHLLSLTSQTLSRKPRHAQGDQSFVGLEVRDLTGRLVTTLNKGYGYANHIRTVWNGTGQKGAAVTNGQYILTLTTSGNRVSKMVVLQQ